MCQSARKYAGKIVAGSIIVGTIAGIGGCVKNMSEEIYRGNIKGYSVVYEENRFTIEVSSNFQKNRMTAQKGDITYVFDDIINETNIDWENQQKPDFDKDILERVVIRKGDSSKKYSNPYNNKKNSIDTSTLQGQRAQEVFNKANPLYKSLREKIRESLQNKYETEQKPFIDSFQE